MLERLFKRNGAAAAGSVSPALDKLRQLGPQKAECTIVRTADGLDIDDEIGPVDFFHKDDRIFTRDSTFYLAPPNGKPVGKSSFSGRGAVLDLRFYARHIPYTLQCQVVQRIRFSDRLMGGMIPQSPFGYKLTPLGNPVKNESRKSLRFATMRGVGGPQASPNLRFDLFVERLKSKGLAHNSPPRVIPLPGDDSLPEELEDDFSPEALIHFFNQTLNRNPPNLQGVHLSKVVRDGRSRAIQMLDLGKTAVLGLGGEAPGKKIHLRTPKIGHVRDRRNADCLSEGDLVVLNFIGKGMLEGADNYFRMAANVYRCGVGNLILSPKGLIRKQTGLPVPVRDFSVNGVGLQNSPLLEDYLVGKDREVDSRDEIIDALVGTQILLHLHPRLHFTQQLEAYCPKIPAYFPLLGEIVRTKLENGKDGGTITELGVRFSYEPADYGWEKFEVRAWEPLRNVRENAHFKEAHRSLNAMLAFLDK